LGGAECINTVPLEDGRCVAEKIIQSSCDSDVFVGNSLVVMYAKCESMEDAWKVFNKMAFHDVISWKCPAWGILACMDMVRKLLSICNQCVKKV
jgi:pentatricopeptide repeat protein